MIYSEPGIPQWTGDSCAFDFVNVMFLLGKKLAQEGPHI
jgi:hypothetical protein